MTHDLETALRRAFCAGFSAATKIMLDGAACEQDKAVEAFLRHEAKEDAKAKAKIMFPLTNIESTPFDEGAIAAARSAFRDAMNRRTGGR